MRIRIEDRNVHTLLFVAEEDINYMIVTVRGFIKLTPKYKYLGVTIMGKVTHGGHIQQNK